MIIEFTNQSIGMKRICLIHHDLGKDRTQNVKNVVSWLISADYAALPVPCGQPCPTNPLPKIQIFNGGNEALLNVITKINAHAKPGAIISLSKEEFNTWEKANENGEVITL